MSSLSCLCFAVWPLDRALAQVLHNCQLATFTSNSVTMGTKIVATWSAVCFADVRSLPL